MQNSYYTKLSNLELYSNRAALYFYQTLEKSFEVVHNFKNLKSGGNCSEL